MDPSTSLSSPPFSLSALSSFFTPSHPPNPSEPGSPPGEAATSVHSHTMRCGGCGSKVGVAYLHLSRSFVSSFLRFILRTLSSPSFPF
jgi:hypothetical protein